MEQTQTKYLYTKKHFQQKRLYLPLLLEMFLFNMNY